MAEHPRVESAPPVALRAPFGADSFNLNPSEVLPMYPV
jgi:hypothetical protein